MSANLTRSLWLKKPWDERHYLQSPVVWITIELADILWLICQFWDKSIPYWLYMYIYIYMCVHIKYVHMYTYIHIYIYISYTCIICIDYGFISWYPPSWNPWRCQEPTAEAQLRRSATPGGPRVHIWNTVGYTQIYIYAYIYYYILYLFVYIIYITYITNMMWICLKIKD